MAVTFIRTVIIFITLVIVMRIMGKRQIGEMQPFEFIVTLIIADLACIPMADISIPVLYGIVSILGLFLLHQIFSVLEQKRGILKRIISGKPSVIINKNGVDMKELRRNNMGVDDLIESMRSQGYFSLDDLDYAIFEANGNLSALENQNSEKHPSSIPVLLIENGKFVNENIKFTKKDETELKNFLLKENLELKNTEVLTLDGNGRVYYKAKNQKYQILNLPLKEENKW